MTYRILDLFCCAGGAGVGYARAGFNVVGVDITPRSSYPFRFMRANALDILWELAGWAEAGAELPYDAIHASPPCQSQCAMTKGTNKRLADRYEDLYEPVRDLMYATGLPGVIENPSARADWTLCGEMFGLGVIRHRRIELVNWTAEPPAHVKHRGRVRGWRHGEWHDGPYIAAYGKGGGKGTVSEMQKAMGIDWTDVHEELTEAIPPAYGQAIGTALHDWLDTTH